LAQRLAMDVAEQFFRRLLARIHTVETALHAIRIDYLDLTATSTEGLCLFAGAEWIRTSGTFSELRDD